MAFGRFGFPVFDVRHAYEPALWLTRDFDFRSVRDTDAHADFDSRFIMRSTPDETSASESDIPADSTTTTTLTVGGSVVSTIDTAGDNDWIRIELEAGVTYQFTLNGTGASALSDPLLELRNSSGSVVASNDDISPSDLNSLITYTPTTGGTFYLDAQAYQSAVGEYTLSASQQTAPPAQDPTTTIDWGSTVSGTALTVYFATTGETFDGNTAAEDWTTAEKAAAMAAFGVFSDVSNLTFAETSNQASATFTLVKATLDSSTLGYFNPPGTQNAGIGVFNHTNSTWTSEALEQGGYAFVTLIHEFGHGLGLAHPHDDGGTSTVMSGVTASSGSYGDAGLNQGVFTVMSYNDGWPTGPNGVNTGENGFGWMGTLSPIDIAVIQAKYGINTSTNTGDTSFVLSGSNAPGTMYASIWDAGGTDVITYSGSADAVIDLREASLENVTGGGGYVSYVTGVIGGFTIANGVVIENAVGGSGNDTMTGNSAANVFTGNGGNDTIVGGDGNDTAVYSGASSDYSVTDNGDGTRTIVDLRAGSPDGTDTLTGIETIQYSSNADPVNGDEDANTINGTSGNDLINGLGGDDVLQGLDGDDTINGGNGADYIRGNGGNDQLYGDAGSDTIVGDEGDDQIFGGADYDKLYGREGNDTISGGSENDRIFGGLGNDTINGDGGNDFLLGEEGDDVINGGAGQDVLFGNDGNDTLNGGDERDVILAGAGNDTANGDGGDDYMRGYEGNDTLRGGDGADIITGNEGDDVIYGDAGADKLYGRQGNDTLHGGDGDDIIEGTEGVNTLNGDAGNDIIRGGIGNDTANGGVGADNIVGWNGDDVIDGGAGDDYLRGDNGNDIVRGGDGIDRVIGNDGNDQLFGDAGDDIGYGGTGDDEFTGGAGDDRFYGEDGSGDVAIFSGNRDDYALSYNPDNGLIVVRDLRDGSPDGTDTMFDVETIRFADGSAAVNAGGFDFTASNAKTLTFSSAATSQVSENQTSAYVAVANPDPEAEGPIRYSISGTDANLFDINAETGELSFKLNPDFEAPTDTGQNNVYDVTITASDGVSSGSQTVAISVLDANDTSELPESAATEIRMVAGGSYTGQVDTGGDRDWIAITLKEGETYRFDAFGSGANELIDPYLRLYDPAGTLIKENDDIVSGVERDSTMVFTAPSSGTYFVSVGAWENPDPEPGEAPITGVYTLTARLDDGVYTNDEIADYLNRNGSRGLQWDVSTGDTITVNLTALTADGINLARLALESWSDVTGIIFQEVSTGGQITFDDNEDGAFAQTTMSGGFITAARVNVATQWLVDNSARVDGYSHQVYIHEVGHALGLGHGGPYNGAADYAADAIFLNDSWQSTIMSYFDQGENTWTSASPAFVTSPQIADIIAVQNMYGASATSRLGDTVYGFNSNAGRVIYDATALTRITSYVIYDSGGNDTMDYSGSQANQILNLNAEAYSSLQGGTGNVSIARGTVIENAIGGTGNDTLIGNAADNTLTGNAGNDAFYASGGADIFDGGAGSDTAYFAGLETDYSLSTNSSGQTVVTDLRTGSPDGATTLINIESIIYGQTYSAVQGLAAPRSSIDLIYYDDGYYESLDGLDLHSHDKTADTLQQLGLIPLGRLNPDESGNVISRDNADLIEAMSSSGHEHDDDHAEANPFAGLTLLTDTEDSVQPVSGDDLRGQVSWSSHVVPVQSIGWAGFDRDDSAENESSASLPVSTLDTPEGW